MMINFSVVDLSIALSEISHILERNISIRKVMEAWWWGVIGKNLTTECD